MNRNIERKFKTGSLSITYGVKNKMRNDSFFSIFVGVKFALYVQCYWGGLSDEDWKLNDEAVENGGRILASYTYNRDGTKIWIITEADRSVTTILFPNEY